jgi:hypothetical protein
MLHPSGSVSHGVSTSAWKVPGDLISNGRFDAGLKNWVPQQADASGSDVPTVSIKGLRLTPGAGVRQQLDVDVVHARSLLLWADLRIDKILAGKSAADNDPNIDIEVCYQDIQGGQHCGAQAHHIEFYAGNKGIPGDRKSAGITQHIPVGQWYRYQIDLLDMKPTPAHIESIALHSAGSTDTAWVREIHLILRGGEHATQ